MDRNLTAGDQGHSLLSSRSSSCYFIISSSELLIIIITSHLTVFLCSRPFRRSSSGASCSWLYAVQPRASPDICGRRRWGAGGTEVKWLDCGAEGDKAAEEIPAALLTSFLFDPVHLLQQSWGSNTVLLEFNFRLFMPLSANFLRWKNSLFARWCYLSVGKLDFPVEPVSSSQSKRL